MKELIKPDLIGLAESIQLPERIVNTDDLLWIPFDEKENCHFKPIRFDLTTGNWTYLFKIKSNRVLGKHRHTGGCVIGYNISGEWWYEGREWIARPRTYIFEPPGDIHTLVTGDQEVVTLFILGGSLQYFDEQNNVIGQDDIFTVIKKYRDYCKDNGLEVREDLFH